MADFSYRAPDPPVARHRTDWGAIWGGVFTVVAIWSVFGFLGASIFEVNLRGSDSPWGMGIWSIGLTMVAMYVGGRVTGHFALVETRTAAFFCGMTMFGLSAVSTAVMILAAAATSAGSHTLSASYVSGVIANIAWFGLVALLLGWLCAIGGVLSAVRPRPTDGQASEAVQNIGTPA